MLITVALSILTSIFISFPQTEIRLEQELNYKADFFIFDQLGYLYLINGTELQKIDLKTKKEKSFSNLLAGNIYSVDVSDPFKTLIFYKDFNKLDWLDKNFGAIASTISLDDLGFNYVASVCQSVNGGFWLFDQSLFQIVYLDKNLKTTHKSTQFSEMIDQNTELDQVYMLEKNDYIYLGINGNSILIFDSYGTYIKTYPINYNRDFQVNNETIVYYEDQKLKFYNTTNYSEEQILLPDKKIRQVRLENKKIFMLTTEKLLIYQPDIFK
ncbi:MAG: hypothetical protein C0597_00670 [Marinilabiliales bacterium]|nr:MAG: hypothetical protein C0597_00670 [Marinilabiliales bacterium]